MTTLFDQPNQMIEYTAVEQMADTYREATAAIRAAAATIGEQTAKLAASFAEDSSYAFGIELRYQGESFTCHTEARRDLDDLLRRMHRHCWGKIIEKLNIRRLMSSKRARDLDNALAGKSCYDPETERDVVTDWPELTPENIQRVAQGYLMSATEFLEEAVAEEYDWWRPSQNSGYKTNAAFWKLDRKVIHSYLVERKGYAAGFRLTYHGDRSNHVTALDNIFHMLDGKGPTPSYKGELATAIEQSPDGKGETQYFKFKCYGNGNLHLEFKRRDLLDLFNTIAAKRGGLPRERRSA